MSAPHLPANAPRVPADVFQGVLDRAATVHQLGRVTAWHVITTGYEDTNLAATTSTGPVVVKVFLAHRGAAHPVRTVRLIEDAIRVGVRHPRLLPARTGAMLTRDTETGNHVLVMEAVDGRDYYSPTRAPTATELADLAAQAARIHCLPPPADPVLNPWALPNLPTLARLLHPRLDDEQRQLIAAAATSFTSIAHADLPHALIHNDLTKGNVLAHRFEAVSVIDFGCADWYPLIQELAVIAANLTHGDDQPLLRRAETIAQLYAHHRPLSRAERRALPAYTAAAAAMELLGALRAWHIDRDHRPETAYLIDLGMSGLRDLVA